MSVQSYGITGLGVGVSGLVFCGVVGFGWCWCAGRGKGRAGLFDKMRVDTGSSGWQKKKLGC